jgi:hypothetical protein
MKQFLNAGKGFALRKEKALLLFLFFIELIAGNRQLSPLMERVANGTAWDAHELCLDRPW